MNCGIIKKKKQEIWIFKAHDRDRKLRIDGECGDRCQAPFQKVIGTLFSNGKRYELRVFQESKSKIITETSY